MFPHGKGYQGYRTSRRMSSKDVKCSHMVKDVKCSHIVGSCHTTQIELCVFDYSFGIYIFFYMYQGELIEKTEILMRSHKL